MKIFKIIPTLFILGCIETIKVHEKDLFLKYYGDNASFEMVDMTHRSDGKEGVVLFAKRTGTLILEESEISDVSDFYVVVTDEYGNAETSKKLEVSIAGLSKEKLLSVPFKSKQPSNIFNTSDGYLVIGTMPWGKKNAFGIPIVDDFTNAIIWAKYDNDFNLVGDNWSTYADSVYNYYGVDIIQTSDNDYLVGGYTDIYGTNDYIYFRKKESEIRWKRILERDNSDDRIVKLLNTKNDQFVILGRTDRKSEDGETGANVEIAVLNELGVIMQSAVNGITWTWENDSEEGNLWDVPYDIIQNPLGFKVVGTSYRSEVLNNGIPFVMNFQLYGFNSDINYVKALNPNVNATANVSNFGDAYGITKKINNDFMIVGKVDGLNDEGDQVMIFGTDQGGSLNTKINRYGLVNGNDKALRAMTTEGGILVGGTYDFGGGMKQLVLMKINDEGEFKIKTN